MLFIPRTRLKNLHIKAHAAKQYKECLIKPRHDPNKINAYCVQCDLNVYQGIGQKFSLFKMVV